MRLPLCFLLFHFEEDTVVFGCSSSHSFGLVRLVWRLNEVLPFGLPSFEENTRWHFVREHLLDAPNMISQTRSLSGCLVQLMM
jgi:hypothetical protein